MANQKRFAVTATPTAEANASMEDRYGLGLAHWKAMAVNSSSLTQKGGQMPTTDSVNTDRTIALVRPLHGACHLSVKGEPQIMEDGSVGLKCKDKDSGGKYWLNFSPDVVRAMIDCLDKK